MSLVKNQKTFVKSIIIIIDRKFIFKNVSSLVYLKRGHYVDCQDTSKVSLIFGKTPDLFGLTLTSIRNKRVPLIRSKLPYRPALVGPYVHPHVGPYNHPPLYNFLKHVQLAKIL